MDESWLRLYCDPEEREEEREKERERGVGGRKRKRHTAAAALFKSQRDQHLSLSSWSSVYPLESYTADLEVIMAREVIPVIYRAGMTFQ